MMLKTQIMPFLVLVLALITPGFAQVSSTGQTEDLEASFVGPWAIQMDDASSYFLIVKKGNRASFFYSDRNDHTVYNGEWQIFGDGLFISWETGRTDMIRGIDSSNFRVAHFGSGYTGSEQPDLVGIAQKMPESQIGTWTVSPEELERQSTAKEEVEGFFGTWEIKREDGLTYYLIVNDDRTAASSYPNSRKGSEGLRGSWLRQGSELHIEWDTGHYQVLRERPQDYVTELFEPATDLTDPPETIRTRRVEFSTPGNWFENYQNEVVVARANAFQSRNETNVFFRGNWHLLVDGQEVQEIRVGRFGDIEIVGSRMEGTWRSQTDAMYFYWDDGFRAVLKPIFLSFTYSIFAPGQPFDGTPTRIYSAIPSNPEKIEQYAKRKEAASMRLRFFRQVQERLEENPPPPDKKRWWELDFGDMWPF